MSEWSDEWWNEQDSDHAWQQQQQQEEQQQKQEESILRELRFLTNWGITTSCCITRNVF